VADPPVKVLYIAGVSHCGSTFLGALLGQVDGFFFAGELAHTARSLERGHACGCGLPLAECPVWQAIFAGAFGSDGGPELLRLDHDDERARAAIRDLVRERRGAPRSAALARAGDAFASTLRAIRDTTGAAVVVDSSKSPAYGRLLESTSGIDLRVLHLVRDPRATAWSWQKTPELNARPPAVALIWDVWNPLIELLWARRRDRYLRLRYEDFATRPRETIDRILAFVGEPREELPFLTEREVQLDDTHSVEGNPSRFRTGRVEVRLDDQWLTRREFRGRRAVGALTLPLRLRYRYPRPGAAA
jgi:hypothetical protein